MLIRDRGDGGVPVSLLLWISLFPPQFAVIRPGKVQTGSRVVSEHAVFGDEDGPRSGGVFEEQRIVPDAEADYHIVLRSGRRMVSPSSGPRR